MVAKISHMSSLHAALAYNQNKVGQDSARVISSHRMISDVVNNPENVMQQVIFSFENYLIANRRTVNPILHISLNPSPEDRLADEQFGELARDYMEKMGYGDQPYIVYLHEDTGRRHIHIVSTCVDENGKKISDAYEWRRSMQACRELEQQYGLKQVADKRNELAEPYLKKVDPAEGDLKQQVSNTLKSVLSTYKFQTFGEYSALLVCFNIEAKQVRGEYNGEPYTGIVYTVVDETGKVVSPPFKSSLFGKPFGHNGLTKKMNRHALDYKNKKWSPKIRDSVKLAMLTCGGKQKDFERTLQNKGVDVMFRRNDEGRIYGVTFIDHHNREVYNGSRLGKEFSANQFERLFNDPSHPMRQQQPDIRADHPDKETALDLAFGLFSIEPSGPDSPDYEEEAFARRMKRKKNRGRSM